jgi:hypothetical protein
VRYQAFLNYSVDTHVVEPGMDVPYKQYREDCKSSGRIPVADYLYPFTVYEKKDLEFLVEADSLEEAADKVLAHTTTKRAIGKAARNNGIHGLYFLTTEKEGVGAKVLVVKELPPERQAKVITID